MLGKLTWLRHKAMSYCKFVRPSATIGQVEYKEGIFKMAQILQDKSLATKFQILVEIAAGQPDIQQKDIARRLNVTPQWVSEYIVRLVEDGWVISEGRSKYRVTNEGVNWLLKALEDEMPDLLQRLEKESLGYELLDPNVTEHEQKIYPTDAF